MCNKLRLSTDTVHQTALRIAFEKLRIAVLIELVLASSEASSV